MGEADKRTEDYIVLKVFGISAASQNIKQDLVAVLQKKLDDKVGRYVQAHQVIMLVGGGGP